MKKDTVLLTLALVFLPCAMIVMSAMAQPRIVGVFVGNSFKYGDIAVNWSSNDPNATFPPLGWEWVKEFNETEWASLLVVDVSGTIVTVELVYHYNNGTERAQGGYVDIDTGTGNITTTIISANLNANDTIYSSAQYSNRWINETIIRTYQDGTRETNHQNQTWRLIVPGYEYYWSWQYYWDRSTGILVEELIEQSAKVGSTETAWSLLIRITESNVWVVPEFPTSASILLTIVMLTLSLGLYKRRLTQKSIKSP